MKLRPAAFEPQDIDGTRYFNWLVFLPIGFAVLIMIILMAVVNAGDEPSGPRVIPTTYAPPTSDRIGR